MRLTYSCIYSTDFVQQHSKGTQLSHKGDRHRWRLEDSTSNLPILSPSHEQSHRAHSPPSHKNAACVRDVTAQGSPLDTQVTKVFITWGWSHRQPNMYQKSQTPKMKAGIQHKPYCLHKQSGHWGLPSSIKHWLAALWEPSSKMAAKANLASRAFSGEQAQICYVNSLLNGILINTLEPEMKSITREHKTQNVFIQSFHCAPMLFARYRAGLYTVCDLLRFSYPVNNTM